MWITIDAEDRRPIYQQVADGIKGLIAKGDLAQGQALPPVRQLAADLGVNLNTIATAYRSLQDEGLIAIRHGSGAVVSASRTRGTSRKDLQRNLGAVLAQLVLTGRSRREILDIVAQELDGLRSGVKR
jgi:DNA-binding transcriptional regulator YhcF (GntR family)